MIVTVIVFGYTEAASASTPSSFATKHFNAKKSNFESVTAPVIASVGPEGEGAVVSWVPGAPDIESYKIKATPDIPPSQHVAASCEKAVATSVSASDTETVVGGLCASVAYYLTLVAVTADGSSPSSKRSDLVVVEKPQPPFVPTIASIFGRNTSIVLTWTTPAYDGGDRVSGYVVTATSSSSTVTVDESDSKRVATISGLTNAVVYDVSLVAKILPANRSRQISMRLHNLRTTPVDQQA